MVCSLKGWRGTGLQFTRMVSDGDDPPVFSFSSPPSSLERRTLGTTMKVEFGSGLSKVMLDKDKYYIPATVNNLVHRRSQSHIVR